MDKAQLRRHLRVRLHALSNDERRRKSLSICKTFISSTEWTTVKRVSCYQSKSALREVDTQSITDYIRVNHPDITIDLVKPDSKAPLPHGRYDIIVVPLLGFDDNCNRLGRGGGWYDRFLSAQDSAKKIGLAFNVQHMNAIPVEDFDVELDDVITED